MKSLIFLVTSCWINTTFSQTSKYFYRTDHSQNIDIYPYKFFGKYKVKGDFKFSVVYKVINDWERFNKVDVTSTGSKYTILAGVRNEGKLCVRFRFILVDKSGSKILDTTTDYGYSRFSQYVEPSWTFAQNYKLKLPSQPYKCYFMFEYYKSPKNNEQQRTGDSIWVNVTRGIIPIPLNTYKTKKQKQPTSFLTNNFKVHMIELQNLKQQFATTEDYIIN